MANTVVINGKVYTERTIDNIVVEGNTINGNLIPEEYSKEGELVTLDINIQSLQEQGAFKAATIESNESSESTDFSVSSVSNESVGEVPQKETFKNKFIKAVIKFLSKFIHS